MILVWIWTQCDTSLRGVHSLLNHGVKGFPPSLQGCRNNPCVWLCGREGLNGHSSTDLTICLLFCLSYTLRKAYALENVKHQLHQVCKAEMLLNLGLFCSLLSPGLHLQRNVLILEISPGVCHIWGLDFQVALLKKTDNWEEDLSLRVKGLRTDRSQGAGMGVVCYCLSENVLGAEWEMRWQLGICFAFSNFFPLGLEQFLNALGIWSCLDSGGWWRDLGQRVRVHVFKQPLVKMTLNGVPK